MAVGASFGARLEHLRARKGTKETELAKSLESIGLPLAVF